jgi:peptidyl-prolyl cis-trans isomerase SurA
VGIQKKHVPHPTPRKKNTEKKGMTNKILMPSGQKMLSKILLGISAACLLTGFLSAPSKQPLDRILVVVADEIVLLSDLQKAIQITTNKATKLLPDGKLVGGNLSPDAAQNVLEQLINQKVISVKTRELGLQISEEELSSEIENYLRSQNISQEKLVSSLQDEGETYDTYREEFRHQMETQRIIGRVVRPSVSVTDDDVKSFYLQQPGVAEKQQRVKLRRLFIDLSPSLAEQTLSERKAYVSKIEKESRDATDSSPVDFERLVKLYSSDPDAVKSGGALPPKELRELPAELRAKISNSTKTGSVIGPLEIGSATYFFQYLGTTLSNESEFEKQKAQLKNILLDAKGNERLSEYLQAERTKTKIEKRSFKFTR